MERRKENIKIILKVLRQRIGTINKSFVFPSNVQYLIYLTLSPLVYFMGKVLSKLDEKYIRLPNLLQRLITLGKVKTRFGIFYLEPMVGMISRFTLWSEPETTSFIINFKPAMFIDIGSYVGKYTVLASKSASKIISIEPNPFVFKYLIKNIRLNKCDKKVKALNVCIYEKECTLPFNIDFLYGTRSSLTVKFPKKIKVKCIPLDIIVKKIPKKTLIKIDVEGSELFVLKSMKEILKKNPTLIVEIWNVHKAKKIQKFLREFGYERVEVFDRWNYVFKKV